MLSLELLQQLTKIIIFFCNTSRLIFRIELSSCKKISIFVVHGFYNLITVQFKHLGLVRCHRKYCFTDRYLYIMYAISRSLRRQHRVRVHVNFFLSFVLSGTFSVVWGLVITYARLTSDSVADTHLFRNTVSIFPLSLFRSMFAMLNDIIYF